MKADLAIYSHVLGVSGQYKSVGLMFSYELNFSTCVILDGFANPITSVTDPGLRELKKCTMQ